MLLMKQQNKSCFIIHCSTLIVSLPSPLTSYHNQASLVKNNNVWIFFCQICFILASAVRFSVINALLVCVFADTWLWFLRKTMTVIVGEFCWKGSWRTSLGVRMVVLPTVHFQIPEALQVACVCPTILYIVCVHITAVCLCEMSDRVTSSGRKRLSECCNNGKVK